MTKHKIEDYKMCVVKYYLNNYKGTYTEPGIADNYFKILAT